MMSKTLTLQLDLISMPLVDIDLYWELYDTYEITYIDDENDDDTLIGTEENLINWLSELWEYELDRFNIATMIHDAIVKVQ